MNFIVPNTNKRGRGSKDPKMLRTSHVEAPLSSSSRQTVKRISRSTSARRESSVDWISSFFSLVPSKGRYFSLCLKFPSLCCLLLAQGAWFLGSKINTGTNLTKGKAMD